MTPRPTLPAGPVTLHRWDESRVEALDRAIDESLPELRRHMPWATDAHNLDDTREYVERSMGEWERGESWNYAMVLADGQVVGSCGLMTRMGPGVLEIGYWVHSAHTGNGYASAIARALAEEGLQVQGIDRVVIKHDVANPASGRVAAKAGFVRVGEEEVEPTAEADSGHHLIWERRLTRVGR